MEIVLNGEPRDVAEGTSVAQLLGDMGLAQKRLALEINREIVPRSTFETRRLAAGDSVEIVHAIGGG
ncbi:sulfur carrier protein ThiS [Ectothiorhodospiraceae bacterium 2226]|nr:sulfur carrier protein ThiS [Ectothiorhodospiraceae bacterium 2226]